MKHFVRSRGKSYIEGYISRPIAIHLAISFIRNFLLGLFLLLFIDQLRTSPAIDLITKETGYEIPAVLLILSSLIGVFAWVKGKTIYARIGILLGAVVLLALVTSYFVTLIEGTPQTGNWLVVLLTSIVAHDFTLLSQPFINPTKITAKAFLLDERVR